MHQTTITIDPIFLQILAKLLHSTLLTMAGLLCMKAIHTVYELLGGQPRNQLAAPAERVRIKLTNKQRKQIKAETGQDLSIYEILDEDIEESTNALAMGVSIKLTKTQSDHVKRVMDRDISEIIITKGNAKRYALVKKFFGRHKLTERHHDPAMSVLEFADKWASVVIFVVYLGLKMYVNIKGWTS